MPADGRAGQARLSPAPSPLPPPCPTGSAARWGDGGGSGYSPASYGWDAWRSGRREPPGNKSRRRPALRQERAAPSPPSRTGRTGLAAPPPAGSAGEDSRTCSAGRDAPHRARASASRSGNPLPAAAQPRRAVLRAAPSIPLAPQRAAPLPQPAPASNPSRWSSGLWYLLPSGPLM